MSFPAGLLGLPSCGLCDLVTGLIGTRGEFNVRSQTPRRCGVRCTSFIEGSKTPKTLGLQSRKHPIGTRFV